MPLSQALGMSEDASLALLVFYLAVSMIALSDDDASAKGTRRAYQLVQDLNKVLVDCAAGAAIVQHCHELWVIFADALLTQGHQLCIYVYGPKLQLMIKLSGNLLAHSRT